jgi:hypothetical protein
VIDHAEMLCNFMPDRIPAISHMEELIVATARSIAGHTLRYGGLHVDLSAFRQRRPEPVNFCLIVALNHERYGMFPAPIGAYQWCPPFRGRVTASPKGDAVVYVTANAYA